MDKSEIVLDCIFDGTTPTLLDSYEITIQINSEPDYETLIYSAKAGDVVVNLFIHADGTVDEPDPEMTETLCRHALAVYLFAQPSYRADIYGGLQQHIKDTCARVASTGMMMAVNDISQIKPKQVKQVQASIPPRLDLPSQI
jgi:hypothetical protein